MIPLNQYIFEKKRQQGNLQYILKFNLRKYFCQKYLAKSICNEFLKNLLKIYIKDLRIYLKFE